jgi:hypothetical protein
MYVAKAEMTVGDLAYVTVQVDGQGWPVFEIWPRQEPQDMIRCNGLGQLNDLIRVLTLAKEFAGGE